MGRRRGWYSSWRYERRWPRYVPVAERRAQAKRRMERLIKKGEKLDPVVLEGRTIARTFWGKAWCDHLEAHCDFWNRLPRGRSYVRNGSVCDLVIEPGWVAARVIGNDLYRVEINIKKLSPVRWRAIRRASTGGIASIIELLQGRLSAAVMAVMVHPTNGLFPRPQEIEMRCSCPDFAVMCKHVAAMLYGVGARLDSRPELLFVLRGVDHMQLVEEVVQPGVLAGTATGAAGLEERELAEIFGVEIETPDLEPPAARRPGKKRAAVRIRVGKGTGKRAERGKKTNKPASRRALDIDRGSL
jgi:uncharacterized Zn finger protein